MTPLVGLDDLYTVSDLIDALAAETREPSSEALWEAAHDAAAALNYYLMERKAFAEVVSA